jgi:hypothetical protein
MDFHRDLRRWYYDVGGLYMSENARRRYGSVQELVAAHCSGEAGGVVQPEAYDDLMGACSAFRSALTEDLESRRQGSLIYSIQKSREHAKQERTAQKRLRRASTVKNGTPPQALATRR